MGRILSINCKLENRFGVPISSRHHSRQHVSASLMHEATIDMLTLGIPRSVPPGGKVWNMTRTKQDQAKHD